MTTAATPTMAAGRRPRAPGQGNPTRVRERARGTDHITDDRTHTGGEQPPLGGKSCCQTGHPSELLPRGSITRRKFLAKTSNTAYVRLSVFSILRANVCRRVTGSLPLTL